MEILRNLTIKHLLMNKRRTLVTIIGIILSTALMVGIGLLFSSLYQATYEDAIKSYGDYHTVFKNIDGEKTNVLINNLKVKEVYYEKNIGYSYLDGSKNEDKIYLKLKSVSSNFFERLNLIEGRFPENSNELIISRHIQTNGGVKLNVGDTIKLELGYRVSDDGKVLDIVNLVKDDNFYYDENGEIINTIEFTENEKLQIVESREFTIVGEVERPIFEERSSCGYSVFTIDDNLTNEEYTNTYVVYKNPRKTYDIAGELKEELGIKGADRVSNNNMLLYYYGTSERGNFTAAVAGMMSIALGLISVGCIIVIYNSFAISTMERKKQFGLLSSVGATKRQIRNSVFFEAIVVGGIGIILGTASAFIGIYCVLKIMNQLLKGVISYTFYLTVNPVFISIPLIFMFAVVLISAWLPAKRASRVTPVEAIRQNDDIKINKRKIRTSKLVRKVFGIEGEIALKNMKRNKKKYRITIISLFISIVMFISFSSYLQYVVDSSEGLVYQFDYDTSIILYEENEKVKNEMTSIPYIEKYSIQKQDNMNYKPLDKKYYTDEFYEHLNSNPVYGAEIINVSENEYKEYINKIHGNYGDTILINRTQYRNDSGVGINTKVFNNELEGGSIQLEFTKINEQDKSTKVSTYTISNIKLTEETIFGLEANKYNSQITMILNDNEYEKFREWREENNQKLRTNIIMKATDIEKLAEECDRVQDDNRDISMYVNNIALNLRQENNMVLAIKILLYGFITLVTLIGVSSVFNTISTSISLRQKEFAMLRSIGLTPFGFNKILFFESIFFGIKSLIYSLPVSLLIVYLIASTMENIIKFSEILIPWNSIIISIIGVFVIVLATMMYSASKIKKENILEAIRQENI